ncbi:DUF4240 domain-containing protein [Sporocytophaga myxococcoides]|uniref:DUF4240 domain-containing protein n=1 Tax=Sporocytophaga myxococcoides TaxID=153721 RepID=UPI0005F08D0A|nr:DUF4240 domain-containing protein [Sporocytophaga myxococcoides]
MDIVKFWDIIEQSKKNTNEDIYLQLDNLREELQHLNKDEIVKAQEIFLDLMDQAYKWDLWAAAYTIQGGCSDDGFIDFRAWLIGRGKEIYYAALENSDSLSLMSQEALKESEAGEEYNYLFAEAYEELTDEEMPEIARTFKTNPDGKEWDEENINEFRRINPNLFEKFKEEWEIDD